MNHVNTIINKKDPTINPEDVLKVTALHYFAEALYKENYEECNGLARTAKEFGAGKRDIQRIVTRYVKWVKGFRDLEAFIDAPGIYRW